MTFLLTPQTPSNENLTSMLYISNALIMSGHIVYCKLNPSQNFQNIRFDQVIEIGVKMQPQQPFNAPYSPPQYNFQQPNINPNLNAYNNYTTQQFATPQIPNQFTPANQNFQQNNYRMPNNFPTNYPQPQFPPVGNFQNNFNMQIPNVQSPQPSYPQNQNFNLLPKATQSAITPLPVELKANNLPEFTPSPTVKK